MVEILDEEQRALLATARRAVLATVRPDGRARLVPVCFWLAAEPDAGGHPLLYSALDEKPKLGTDPLQLGRVRDLLGRPDVTLLVDRWDEDWSRLAWLRLEGTARVLGPPRPGTLDEREHAAAAAGLRARYPQYRSHALESRPLIRVALSRAVAWSAT